MKSSRRLPTAMAIATATVALSTVIVIESVWLMPTPVFGMRMMRELGGRSPWSWEMDGGKDHEDRSVKGDGGHLENGELDSKVDDDDDTDVDHLVSPTHRYRIRQQPAVASTTDRRFGSQRSRLIPTTSTSSVHRYPISSFSTSSFIPEDDGDGDDGVGRSINNDNDSVDERQLVHAAADRLLKNIYRMKLMDLHRFRGGGESRDRRQEVEPTYRHGRPSPIIYDILVN